MRHGFGFAEFAAVFAFAYRRVVVGKLFDFAATQKIEPGIAYVSHCHHAVLNERNSENTGHAIPLGAGAGEAVDFVVGEGDGFAEALFGRAHGAFETLADHFNGGLGGLLSGGVPAYAVDYGVDAALGVGVITIFVIFAALAGVGGGGGFHLNV